MSAAPPDADRDAAPRSAHWLVGALLVLLLVPGLVGFDVWPLTGWRLFSLARGPELHPDIDQSAWGIAAVDDEGATQVVRLEDLSLAYRHAQWVMFSLPDASDERRDAVCAALASAAAEVVPDMVSLELTADQPTLVEREGHWLVEHRREVFHECTA